LTDHRFLWPVSICLPHQVFWNEPIFLNKGHKSFSALWIWGRYLLNAVNYRLIGPPLKEIQAVAAYMLVLN